jgi:hypothetical protein
VRATVVMTMDTKLIKPQGPSSNMNKLYGTVNYTARGVNKYAWVPLV